MDTRTLERVLISWRAGEDLRLEEVVALTIEQALAYRDAGNLPDERGRTLRLVLEVETAEDLRRLDAKRLLYESDYLDAPTWRREGSKPVNVVPLRTPNIAGAPQPWWEQQEMAPLEAEWRAGGAVGGIAIPGEYRSFIYKTIVALREAGRPITVASIVGAIERWVSPEQATEIEVALKRENAGA